LLHLGHAYSALIAHDMARAHGGEFLLRIEDTDTARCRADFETAIFGDLAWLGVTWPPPVWRQSERLDAYEAALNQLTDRGVCYPCSCTRRDIQGALSAPQEGAPAAAAAEGPIYPGTCRHRAMSTRTPTDAIRLDMRKAVQAVDLIARPNALTFHETGPEFGGLHSLDATDLLTNVGDIVLARRDIMTASYHLAVVVDDAAQDISHVIRGADLFDATHIHRALQALLGLATPTYHHHRLIRDENGKRLAKRDDARAIATYRSQGLSADDLRKMLDL
jgi:glutamyl-Q tRNA(Asp) synthetase